MKIVAVILSYDIGHRIIARFLQKASTLEECKLRLIAGVCGGPRTRVGMGDTQEESIRLGTTEHGNSTWTLRPGKAHHLQVSETSRRRKDSVGSETVRAVSARPRARRALRFRGLWTRG